MGVGREGGSGQSGGKMGQEKGLFPRETKRGVEKLLALVTNWALLHLFFPATVVG